MAGQATKLGGPWQASPHESPGVLSLGLDCIKLFDLQLQLFQADVRESWSGTWRAFALLAFSTAAVIAALPVAMFGSAEFLRQAWSISIEFSLLLVSGTVLIIAGLLAVWSARRLAVVTIPLRRSAKEMRANLEWIRSVLHEESNDH